MNSYQILEAMSKLHETNSNLEPGQLDQIIITPYAVNEAGGRDYSMEIYGPTSDGNPRGLIIDETLECQPDPLA